MNSIDTFSGSFLITTQLEKLWHIVKKVHLSSLFSFFTTRKIRRLMNLREYSLSDFAIDKSALKIPACSSCHEICCHSAHNKVSLRIIDIAMLIDIKRTDLINMKHEQEEVIISKRPNFSLTRETIGWKLFPTLKQFLGNNQLCMALTPQLTCGLHP